MISGKPKIAIHSMVWGREAVTRLVFSEWKRYNVPVYIATTERWCFKLCKELGFHAYPIDNKPLGRKKNSLVTQMLKEGGWTHMMEMGSDDIFTSPRVFRWYTSRIPSDSDMFGFISCYFISPSDEKALKFMYPKELNGYTALIGAGRIITRRFLEQHSPLWPDDKSKGLDTHSERMLRGAGGIVSAADYSPPILVDIKSDNNIWLFDRLYALKGSKTEEVSYNHVLDLLDTTTKQKIQNYEKS